MDNYVARTDGSVDWIESRLSGKADLGMAKFKETMDAVILGRKTYEKIVDFKIWPFKKSMPVYVMSSQESLRFPKYIPKNVRHTRECPASIVGRLENEGLDYVWVDGMNTIASFIRVNCIDDIVINRFPVLLGTGIPLFDTTICSGDEDEDGNGNTNGNSDFKDMEIKLKVISSKTGNFGVVQTQYRVLSKRKKG